MSKQSRDPAPALSKRLKERMLQRSLAFLDGDVDELPAGERVVFERDADSQRLTRGITALRASFVALPEEPAPTDVWAEVERRSTLRGSPHPPGRVSRGGWFVLAGSAAAAAVVAVFALRAIDTPTNLGPSEALAPSQLHEPNAVVSALVAESQRLERDLSLDHNLRTGMTLAERSSSGSPWQAGRQALMYRLSDLDDQLNAVSLAPGSDATREEELWRRRVELMRSLGELERAQKWQVYRAVVF